MITGRRLLNYLPHLTLVILAAAGSSCKDKKAFNEETAQTTVDLRSAMGEMDEVIKDINTVILEQYTLRGKQSSSQSPTTTVCGVKIDSLGQLSGKMTLNYDGSDCYGRKRTGKVIFSLEDYPLRKWKHKDCVIRIEYRQYRSQRGSDGKFVMLDGVQFLKNESGNTWFELWYTSAPPVSYVHTGDLLKVTYTGNNTAVFNVNRKLTFSYNKSNDVTSCSVQGLGNSLERGNVEAWGQDTEGNDFAAEVTTPYLWRSSCGALAPIKGNVSVVVEGKKFDLKCNYGVDQDANNIGESAQQCPFGWEVTWSRKKRVNSRLFGYY